jgi:DNA-binding response OmpR family regulator
MRVLVAEDARSLADRVAEGLRDQGMAVDIARDGLEAAARLDVNAYDVVVLDRDLPGIHGDALCQIITSRDHRVMVLMLTAAGSPQDRVSGLGLGADDYLAKPFHFPELVLRIRALARRQPAARARILRAAGIELDPATRIATRDGRSLELSVKEFAVLEALLHASPAFLSAEDLLETAWDEHADPFTTTVTVTVSRLRRKLGDPHHHDHPRRRLPHRHPGHVRPPMPSDQPRWNVSLSPRRRARGETAARDRQEIARTEPRLQRTTRLP